MTLSDLAIRRPVFITMVTLAIVVFGLISYVRMGVDMFPDIEFPVATITTIYPGADPASVESEISEKIEEAVSGINGIDQLRSISVENVSQVILMFKLEVDADVAVQEVRDTISRVLNQLPDGIEPPKVEKLNLGSVPVLTLAVGGPAPIDRVTEFARKRVKEQIQSIPGVGSIDIIGGQEREIRVWVDAARLEAYGLAVTDVVGALQANNMEFPGGRLSNGETEYVVKVDGRLKSVADVGDLIVTETMGRRILVRDVARIEDGLEERRSAARLDENRAVTLLVRKQSGANSVAVAEQIKERLAELRAGFPAGWKLTEAIDTSLFVRRSVHAVREDILLGGLLAVLIVFLFLRNGRATVISALALPTSVIGTFTLISYLGFTINVITLLALSLSIGILIDDAIVVIENVFRHMEAGKPPREAARDGTNEIALAVMATTLCIVAVFIPVAFMSGIIGRFFYQFGITVTVAVMISLFVSLTLTPMLSSLVLAEARPNRFYRAVERGLSAVDRAYRRLIGWALAHRLGTVAAALLIFIATLGLASLLKSEFQPAVDQGEFNVTLETPTGTTLERTEAVGLEMARRIRAHTGLAAATILSIGADAQRKVNRGTIYVKMTPKASRAVSQSDFMAMLRQELNGTPGVTVSAEEVNMFGDSGGFKTTQIQFNLRGGDLAELDRLSRRLLAELGKIPGFVDLDTSYEAGKPEIRVKVDRERAARQGVLTVGLGQTVRALVGGVEAGLFKDGGEDYVIRVQLADADRREMRQLAGLKVRTTTGRLAAVEDVAGIFPSSGPTQIDREARMRQVTVLGNLEGDLVLGDAVELIRAKAAELLPPGIITAFEGEAKVMKETFENILFALFLAIVLVYMTLASQFESFVHPLTIMISLPLAVVGALGGLLAAGMTLNMFSMIGIVMLMGLVTKNAILLIDYTNTLRRRDGLPRDEALMTAGPTRLRPILMTTAAMIFGMLPVALATSEGAEMRAPMAVCVIGGLITSTVLTLVVVPVVYTLLDDLAGSRLVTALGRALRPHSRD